MKKTVELNQRFIVLEAECNSVLCPFPFAPCRIEEIHRCQKTPVLFFAIFYYHKQCLIIPWSTRCAVCAKHLTTVFLRIDWKRKQRKRNIPFSVVVARAFVSSSCCCCFAEYINQMYLVRAAPLISLWRFRWRMRSRVLITSNDSQCKTVYILVKVPNWMLRNTIVKKG